MRDELKKHEGGTVSTETAERFVQPYYESRSLDDGYEVRVFMPGVARGSAEISLEDNRLTVTGRRTDRIPEDWKPVQKETRLFPYRLQLQLNVDVDGNAISASAKDGVLTIRLPIAEVAKPRKIDIR